MFHDQVINPNSSVKMILFPKMQTFAFFLLAQKLIRPKKSGLIHVSTLP